MADLDRAYTEFKAAIEREAHAALIDVVMSRWGPEIAEVRAQAWCGRRLVRARRKVWLPAVRHDPAYWAEWVVVDLRNAFAREGS